MSSGWLNWGWFLIRMSYGNVIMSSGWDTPPFLSHPDEIANFDFPQHAVALQRFRILQIFIAFCALYWRHNEPYGVSNHQPHHCLFRRRSTVYSDADQRKLQSSASLAFVWGIHRDRWIPCTKDQLSVKCFHLMTSSCELGNEYISMTCKANYAGFILENYLWIYIFWP